MSIVTPEWPAPDNITAFTTTKLSWTSHNHPPHSIKAREALTSHFNLPSEPIWLNQTHSNIAIQATPEQINSEADAAFTSQPNHICLIITADCLPILLCDREGNHVAAIHAGWRGLANGIIKNTIEAMHAHTNTLLAWIGPSISAKHYEVGEDVYRAFTHKNENTKHAFTAINDNKWLADLTSLAKMQLTLAGITQIYGGNHCTYSQPDLFYSYRREKGQNGRMATLIWREPS